MPEKKKQGRPPVDEPQDTGVYMKFKKDDLDESKAVAKSEGYTFSGWVKMLIRKEIGRIERRKKKRGSAD